jgi:hypothetical protein
LYSYLFLIFFGVKIEPKEVVERRSLLRDYLELYFYGTIK